MMAPTHALLGTCCYLAIYPLPADYFTTATCAALIADIDLKGSWAGQFAGPVGSVVRVFSGGHRKYTHRWWSPLIPSALGYLLSPQFAAATAVGYYSHLLGDKIYDTDGWLEHVLRWMFWPVILVCMIYRMVN